MVEKGVDNDNFLIKFRDPKKLEVSLFIISLRTIRGRQTATIGKLS